MSATDSAITPEGEAGRGGPGDEVTRLVIEASTCFETDRYRAKRCLQRASDLLQHARDRGFSGRDEWTRTGALARWQVRKLTAYIEANISGPIRVRDLAVVANLSMGALSRSFRVSFGISPHAYVMRRRILGAEVRMATTTDSLARIATEFGLSDQSHLCRAFRRIVGVSPALWRRAVAIPPEGGWQATTDSTQSS